jgi:hypothetical protein
VIGTYHYQNIYSVMKSTMPWNLLILHVLIYNWWELLNRQHAKSTDTHSRLFHETGHSITVKYA